MFMHSYIQMNDVELHWLKKNQLLIGDTKSWTFAAHNSKKGHRFNNVATKGWPSERTLPPNQNSFQPKEKPGVDGMSSKITSIHWTQPTESQSFGLHMFWWTFKAFSDVGIPCFSTGVSAIFSPGSPSYIKVTVMRQNHGTSIEYLSSLSVLRLSLCHFSYIPKNTNMDPGK